MANEFAVSPDAQGKILALARGVLARRTQFTEMHNKMETIDIAYARYTNQGEMQQGLDSTGVDSMPGDTPCGDIFGQDDITAPIVVSQVDTMVAYLADVFLSGSPIFPVVSSPLKRKAAEQLEVLIDDHAALGGYVRQLLLMLKDGVKYNISAIEAPWTTIEQFSVAGDYAAKDGRSVKKVPKGFTAIKRLDPYNIVYDYSVSPGDMAAEGDYAGYLEIISKTKLKRLLNKLSTENKVLNTEKALNSWAKIQSTVANNANYKEHPTVSNYITPQRRNNEVNWEVYLGVQNKKAGKDIVNLHDGSSYEKFVLYARILPSDFGIKAPSPNTPQIWKFTIINMDTVIEAERIISAYDCLPILMGQPMEDGLGYQTQSVAEGSIPFQKAASTLFNIRFAAARRAVSDRALYNPELINPKDVNSPVPAAKIPVRLKALSNLGLEGAYRPIPFDMRGTETTINDARTIVGFSQELSGINGPQQGQFQKGNKSVAEWQDTIGGSDNRLRIPALLYECQVFTPLKQILALNIFQYGENAQVVSQRTGEVLDVDIDKLRSEVLSFRIADGYSPKSKLAAVDTLTAGMNMIMNSPLLQQQFGAMLPNVFAHLMQLGGVRDLEQYAQQPQAQPANALQQQALQQPITASIDPTTGLPATSTAPSIPVA